MTVQHKSNLRRGATFSESKRGGGSLTTGTELSRRAVGAQAGGGGYCPLWRPCGQHEGTLLLGAHDTGEPRGRWGWGILGAEGSLVCNEFPSCSEERGLWGSEGVRRDPRGDGTPPAGQTCQAPSLALQKRCRRSPCSSRRMKWSRAGTRGTLALDHPKTRWQRPSHRNPSSRWGGGGRMRIGQMDQRTRRT